LVDIGAAPVRVRPDLQRPRSGVLTLLLSRPLELSRLRESFVSGLHTKVSTGLAGRSDASVDFIQLFVKTTRELEASVPAALKVLKHDGLLWVSYPKGSSKAKSDLNRDILWKLMEKHGMAGVSLVSVDDVWSAMRFRPADMVGKQSK